MLLNQLFTVENLCIAAEICAALLLMAFAIPERKQQVATAENGEKSDLVNTAALREVLCDALLFRGLCGDRHKDKPEWGLLANHSSAHFASAGWEDKLTRLGNRAMLDAFLTRWLRLPEGLRDRSILSMFVLDGYSELLREKGAMAVEQLLRETGQQLCKQFEPTAVIGRYQPDRFLVVQFDRSLAQSHLQLENFKANFDSDSEDSDLDFSEIRYVASVVPLGNEERDLLQSLDRLDEGIQYAIETGVCCVSEVAGSWAEEQAPGSSTLAPASRTFDKPIETTGRPRAATEEDAPVAGRGGAASTIPPGSGTSSPSSPGAKSHVVDDLSPTDVSAVASSEDIASLLEQIQKSKNQGSTSAPSDNSSPSNPTSGKGDATPLPDESAGDGAVTADDIASLFETVKSGIAPPTPKNANAKPNAKPAIDITASSEEDLSGDAIGMKALADAGAADESEAVSADDIAALFQAISPVASTAKSNSSSLVGTVPLNESAGTRAAPSATPAVSSADLENEPVSSDDIAALFAAMGQSGNPK